MFYLGDCLEGMRELDDKSIDLVVTSPPYNLDIQYSKYKDKKPREQYLGWLRDVFLECKRILMDDGHLFVNMGYSNVDPWVAMDVAMTLRDDWILQNHINWVKSIHVNGKTSGHLCPTWEHLFHFTKDGKVNVDRLSVGVPYEYYKENLRHSKSLDVTKPNLRDKGNAWFIPYETVQTKLERGKHPATFPVKLAEDCIKLTGKEYGILVDPFMGTGTAAVAAIKQQWDYIGYDIDEDYVEFSKNRVDNIPLTVV